MAANTSRFYTWPRRSWRIKMYDALSRAILTDAPFCWLPRKVMGVTIVEARS